MKVYEVFGVVAVTAAATGEVARRKAAPGAEAATAPAGDAGSDPAVHTQVATAGH